MGDGRPLRGSPGGEGGQRTKSSEFYTRAKQSQNHTSDKKTIRARNLTFTHTYIYTHIFVAGWGGGRGASGNPRGEGAVRVSLYCVPPVEAARRCPHLGQEAVAKDHREGSRGALDKQIRRRGSPQGQPPGPGPGPGPAQARGQGPGAGAWSGPGGPGPGARGPRARGPGPGPGARGARPRSPPRSSALGQGRVSEDVFYVARPPPEALPRWLKRVPITPEPPRASADGFVPTSFATCTASLAPSSSGPADGLIFTLKGAPHTQRRPQVAFDSATPEEKHRMAHAARIHKEKTADETRAVTWLRHQRRKKAKKAKKSDGAGDGDGGAPGDAVDDGRLAEELAERLRPPGKDDRAVVKPKSPARPGPRFSPQPRERNGAAAVVDEPPAPRSMAVEPPAPRSMAVKAPPLHKAKPTSPAMPPPVQKAAPVRKVDHKAAPVQKAAPKVMPKGGKGPASFSQGRGPRGAALAFSAKRVPRAGLLGGPKSFFVPSGATCASAGGGAAGAVASGARPARGLAQRAAPAEDRG